MAIWESVKGLVDVLKRLRRAERKHLEGNVWKDSSSMSMLKKSK